MSLTQPRNYLIKDAELNWARLGNPVSPFGTPQWELQVSTDSQDIANAWSANFLNVKEKDGKFVVSLKRKAVKADGSPMNPVRVVDSAKNPFENRTQIGNGSKGNVIVWQAPYEVQGRKGISNSLTAVQVTDFVEYASTGGVDFDIVEGETPAAPTEAPLF